MSLPISDLVRESKLDTQFHSNPEYTQHVQYMSGTTLRQRRIRKEERWKRETRLGRGTFGIVWLERCIHGDGTGRVRAVKKVQKLESSDYHRELEAIALFSYSKYEQCFVKSFGWYDDEDSIFITMEYLPHGDLHQYLGSPLPEREGQYIVSQILEGLDFMHSNGFTHRDLKPANILVVCKGPDWWVKIADFGISKRATEGLTALRTLTGTPAFAAPEILGFIQSGDKSDDSYTNVVDIWSLGVITFLILTGEILFKDQRRLGQYIAGNFMFPLDILSAKQVSGQGCAFIRSLMAPKSVDRPGAKECLQQPWLNFPIEAAALESQRTIDVAKSPLTPSYFSDPEPSAAWSTQDQISTYKPPSYTAVLAQMSTSKIREATVLPTSEPAIRIRWQVATTLKGHTDWVSAVVFSPDGKLVASGSGSRDRTVRLWDPATGAALRTLEGHTESVRAVVFSPDGKLVASGSDDRTVRLWDPATGAALRTLEGHTESVWAVVFSPDGKLVASGSGDGTVRLWDPATGAALRTLEGHTESVWAVVFSPDGKLVASGSDDGTVRLWDPATGAALRTLEGHTGSVTAVVFSPDGKLVASGSRDRTVRLWDPATGAALRTLEGHTGSVWAVVFSPDGKLVASGSGSRDRTVRLWDPATGAALRTLEGHTGSVTAVVFSPDGKLVASGSGSRDRTVRLWDPATGAALRTLEGHTESVWAVVFSPDGKLVASGSGDGTVRLWDPAREMAAAKVKTSKKFLSKLFT